MGRSPEPRVRVIGITGGPATGKSTVTGLFRHYGAVTFSADEASRAVTGPGSPALRCIAAEFGGEYFRPDGSLDRHRLGALVFGDAGARRRLEALTHPYILRLLRSQIEAVREDYPHDTTVAVEMPLLFEAGLEGWFDSVVVVAASEETQVRRLQERDGLDETDARRRLAAQMPLQAKTARANHVIWNDGRPAEAASQVRQILGKSGPDPRNPGPYDAL